MSHNGVRPPIAKTMLHSFTHLERSFSDPYHWLEDKTDPAVIDYLEAENAYAQAALAPTTTLQDTLFQEMKGRIEEDERSVPEARGNYEYYWRMEAGQQYRYFCRRPRTLDSAEEVLLDENVLAAGLSYCKVYLFEPSPDNTLVLYGVDTTGAWVFDVYVMDLRTRQILAGPIPNAAWSVGWASDNRTVFYTLFDAAHRSYQLLRHTVGSDTADTLVYQEADEAFSIYIERSRSGDYLFLTSASMSSSEVQALRADDPSGALRMIAPRKPWVEVYAEHYGDYFLMRTNEQAENFKLMRVLVEDSAAAWEEWIPHRAAVLLDGVQAFADYVVLQEREGGLGQVTIIPGQDVAQARRVRFPEPVYAVRLHGNPEYHSAAVRFTYTSMITPESVVDYGLTDDAWVVRKQQVIPSGYDPTQYVCERLMACAPDGTEVPISVVYRKGLVKDGHHPLVLYGYGSYGINTEPDFRTQRLSLLDRGFVWAIGHIRGGSEMGRAWYEQGRLQHKKNSFTDFIACAEALIAQGFTRPEQMAIMGGSAGGLLVSAVMNLRPDLFHAVIALVPFTNVITAMLKPDLPLTVIEYDQWGNPHDAAAFAYMESYSPYDRVEAKEYPHVYIRAGLNDLQVPYWDPAKWAARLRATRTDDRSLLLVTNMEAGHSGSSGRYDFLREMAQDYAWLLDVMGVQA
jgi:oligopeptidase B